MDAVKNETNKNWCPKIMMKMHYMYPIRNDNHIRNQKPFYFSLKLQRGLSRVSVTKRNTGNQKRVKGENIKGENPL